MTGNPRNTAPVTGNNLSLVLKYATLFMMLVAFSFSGAMAQEPEYDVQGIPVEPFVTPDGLFDIDSARAIGFEGALNLSGWSCFIDPETGEPILIQEGDTTNGAQQGKPGEIGTGLPEGAEKSPDDVFWSNEFGLPGFDGAVRAVAFYGGDLYVGGQFRYIDTTYIPFIAKWDGTSWTGVGSGMNSSVYCLEVYNGKLIVGGAFSNAGGGSYEYRIAAWDGASWSALGTGMNSYVWSLTVHNGDLYAGGYFTTAGGVSASRVAKWDGTTWSALGSGTNSTVMALTSHGGDLYAGGQFSVAGGVSANYIAKWDGIAWSSLGSGMNHYVYSLASYGGNLIAGGVFWTAGGTSVGRIASWDGSLWSGLGSGMNHYVQALDVYGGNLVATGYFTNAGGTPANRVATWNGSTWSAVGTGTNDVPYAVTVSGTDLVVGGNFATAGGSMTSRVARWDGSNWNGYPVTYTGKGLNNVVYALAVYNGDLIASGYFTTAGTTSVARIAAWDGTDWSPLGSGLNAWAWDLTVYNGSLIAGGGFTIAGGSSAARIAAWDGSSWSALGSGLNSYVRALHVQGTDLIVGGNFTYAGGSPANRIAKWDGSSWSALGNGFNDQVFALETYGGDLYAGGYFTQSGATSVNRMARWNGSAWNPLGTGMNSAVRALEFYDGKLIAGGVFTTAGVTTAYGIAAWDGSSWSALGSSLYSPGVFALTVRNGKLVAGGYFYRTWSPYKPLNRIAEWDGSNWNNIGSGVNSTVYALQVKDTSLWAGGAFSFAGGKKSQYVARWDKQAGPNDPPIAQCRTVGWIYLDSTCLVDTTNDNGSYDDDGDSITIVYDPPGPYGPGQHLVTLIVTDEHGLADTCQSYIYVRDNTAPTVNAPPDTTVQCLADVPAVDLSEVDVVDNCDPDPTVYLYNSYYSGNCPRTLTRIFRAYDSSSNYSGLAYQYITIDDTIPPVLTCPGDITVQCAANVPNPNVNSVTATDNCTSVSVYFVSDSTDGESCPETIYRKYRGVDNCGNSGYCTQVITINDTIPPVANCPTDITTNASAGQCSKLIAFSISGTDNCGTPTVVATPPSGSSFSVGTTQVEVIATDACGNVDTCQFNVTITDDQAPVASCPANISVGNDPGQCSAAVNFSVSATDNCPGVTVVASPASGSTFPVGTTSVTVIATDASGNADTCTFDVIVTDTESPVATCPANISVGNDPGQCGAVVNFNASATDNCPGVTVVASPASGSSFPVGTTSVTVIATDASGNADTCTFDVIVTDTESPVATCPANISVGSDPGQCSAVVNFNASATDNCPGVTVVESPPSGTAFPLSSTTVTVTATDAAGNTDVCTFAVTVTDTENPSITCPAGIAVQCPTDVPPANPGLAVTSDNCDLTPTVTWQGDVSDGLSCPETITRTYRSTDDFGNLAECTQTIIVDDTIAPVFDQACPSNITVECDAVPTPATLTASDNCASGLTLTYNEDITPSVLIPSCAGNYTLTRTWTATDACGNQAQCVQVITVQDTQAPVFDQPCPANITVECDAVPAPATLTSTDNCDPTPTVTYSQSLTGMTCTGNYTITRTWVAEDDCGNSDQCVQVITVQDTQAPVFDQPCPVNVTVECDAIPAPAVLTATDNCDAAPTVTYQQDSTAGVCIYSYVLTRTWEAADDCGNLDSCVQVITVQDTHAPSLYGVPGDITLQCSDPVPPPANPTPTDNCDPNPTVTMIEDTTAGACPHSFTITRTWTAVDACNNQFQRSQVITIEDTAAPVFDQACPQNATVECSQLVPPAPMTATDNCDPTPDVVLDEVITPGNCTGNYTITNTWTATDACGNVATCVQVINVQDTEAPVFDQPCPANVTVECDAVPQAPTLTATDNCDPAPVVTFNESTTPGTCADSYTLTRTWTGTDDCGNFAQCIQAITVQDTQAPVFDQTCPANLTVDCDAVPESPALTATDNCDTDVQIVFESIRTDGNCAYNYFITNSWFAIDNCNNVDTCTQVITVQDTTSPVCSVPADTSIFQCIPTEICLPVGCSDNCDPEPSTTLVSGPGQLVGGQWCYTTTVDEVAVVTIRCTDSCGNICESSFTVDIDINEPPVVTCRPDTAMFVCDLSPITLDGYSYTDPENNVETVEAPGNTTNGSSITFTPFEGTNVLIFKVTDSCGEVDSCLTAVEIDLNEPPVVSCPNDTTIHFNDILQKTAAFTDGDSPPQTVSFSLGADTPAGVTINSVSGQILWPTNGGDVCGGTIEVIATDGCGEADTCSFDVCVQNTPPIALCDSLPNNICWGETATGGVDGSDPDGGPSVLQYSLASFDGPGTVTLDVNTGDWEWATQEDDSYVGDWELCIGVTDAANLCDPCSPENADTCCLIIHVDRVFEVKIAKTHQTLQGQVETVEVTLESGSREMGGFNFLIDYDAAVLQFTGAVPGPAFYDPAPDGCGWEYFTYRYGPNGNCGASACPSGKLRVIGMAETNNGANHPDCFISPSNLLFSLQFFVSSDQTLECQYVPIRWCWYDCGDNTISSVPGDTLFISRNVFEFEDTLGVNSIANPSAAFPTFFGANSTCDVSGGEGKPEPSRCGIDLWNGGIDIVCADSIDARADLNLNGIPYEVADAVLFSNYFIYGLSVFTVNVEGQMAASDVNGDGIVLSVADLVTLVRVVVGDDLQTPKITNPISAGYVHRPDGVVAMNDEELQMGAALVVVRGETTPELLAPLVQMAYAFDGELTRMLIWSPEGHTFSGSFLQVSGQIVKIEMATADGTPVVAKMVPTSFTLHQNFPNPFNPTTTLSFGLPTASGWELTVYNISGRRVASWSGHDAAGTVQIEWEAGTVASGIYFYKLAAGTFTDTKKMILLK